jgi:hypothetical protein
MSNEGIDRSVYKLQKVLSNETNKEHHRRAITRYLFLFLDKWGWESLTSDLKILIGKYYQT